MKWSRKKLEKTQIANTRVEKGGIATDPIDVKLLIYKNYEQLYINTFTNLKFIIFEKHNLSKLICEEMETLKLCNIYQTN